ncbi:hypothetical protein BDW74DRAFT_154507 [Aspergillus multicolor]|uniref:uncharacterized protein n=1 Tax=Aspergillus multicolor TaxID=41759 RepID=UPI003CCDEFFA
MAWLGSEFEPSELEAYLATESFTEPQSTEAARAQLLFPAGEPIDVPSLGDPFSLDTTMFGLEHPMNSMRNPSRYSVQPSMAMTSTVGQTPAVFSTSHGPGMLLAVHRHAQARFSSMHTRSAPGALGHANSAYTSFCNTRKPNDCACASIHSHHCNPGSADPTDEDPPSCVHFPLSLCWISVLTSCRSGLAALPVFQCKWEGCLTLNPFRREGDLIRHLKTIHISPARYPCLLKNCTKVFRRKDHLLQHQKRRHPDV